MAIGQRRLSDLLDRQAAGRRRAQQLRFRTDELKPGQPLRSVKNHHLSIVDGRDIGPGPGRQERKSVPCAVGHRAPEARKAEPVLARLGEFPLRFGRFRAGELEEMRRWDEAAPFRKPSPLGAEIDDRPSLRPRRRNAPTQLNKLDPVLAPPKDRRGFGRPDIVVRFEIGGRDREYDGDADLAESVFDSKRQV